MSSAVQTISRPEAASLQPVAAPRHRRRLLPALATAMALTVAAGAFMPSTAEAGGWNNNGGAAAAAAGIGLAVGVLAGAAFASQPTPVYAAPAPVYAPPPPPVYAAPVQVYAPPPPPPVYYEEPTYEEPTGYVVSQTYVAPRPYYRGGPGWGPRPWRPAW